MISLRFARIDIAAFRRILCVGPVLFLVLTITFSALAQQPQIIKFNVPGAKSTTPAQINDQGQIAGTYCTGAHFICYGFLRDADGTVTKLQLPGPILVNPVFGINGRGEITGSYTDDHHLAHGFLRHTDGKVTSFETPNAGTEEFAGTYPDAINDEGSIVGSYSDKNADFHGFIRFPDGEFKDFDPPGSSPDPNALGTDPTGISNSGVMVGTYSDRQRRLHGFLRKHGHFTTFELSRTNSETIAQAINAEGAVAGSFFAPNNVIYGFLRFPDGDVQLFTVPGAGAFGTQPLSINDQGEVTGYYTDPQGLNHGFLRDSRGRITKFSVKGGGTRVGEGTVPVSINNSGVIVGYYLDSDFLSHGFLLIP